MSAELMQLVEQAGPYVAAALGAYGTGVPGRAEDAAVDAAANARWQLPRATWRRRDPQGRAELEAAVREAAEEPGDASAVTALRPQIKRTLREDAALARALAGLLPTRGPVLVTASGERAIAAQKINNTITGDYVTIGS